MSNSPKLFQVYPSNDTVLPGDRVKFQECWKCIENSEINLAGLTGTVVESCDEMFAVRLDDKFECLDEWNNQVIWTDHDFLGDDFDHDACGPVVQSLYAEINAGLEINRVIFGI